METPTLPGSRKAIAGAILGTAVGDAVGLPYEGLSRRRAKRLLGKPDRHRFLLRRGMVSDDTEHSCMVMQALIASAGDEDLFLRYLASRMRLWLLGAPAGIGFATLKAALRLCLGVSPRNSDQEVSSARRAVQYKTTCNSITHFARVENQRGMMRL